MCQSTRFCLLGSVPLRICKLKVTTAVTLILLSVGVHIPEFTKKDAIPTEATAVVARGDTLDADGAHLDNLT